MGPPVYSRERETTKQLQRYTHELERILANDPSLLDDGPDENSATQSVSQSSLYDRIIAPDTTKSLYDRLRQP